MDVVLELFVELLLAPIFSLFDSLHLKKFGKHEDAVKVAVMIFVFVGVIGSAIGIGFLLSGEKYFLPGVLLTSICGGICLLYFILCIILYCRERRR